MREIRKGARKALGESSDHDGKSDMNEVKREKMLGGSTLDCHCSLKEV